MMFKDDAKERGGEQGAKAQVIPKAEETMGGCRSVEGRS